MPVSAPITSTNTGPAVDIISALQDLGKTEMGRTLIIEFCKQLERSGVFEAGQNIRETVSGPLMDAVFSGAKYLRKTLNNGLHFDFHYRSKIARDLLLIPDEYPDHIFEPQTTKLLIHLASISKDILIGGAYAGDHAILCAKALEKQSGVCHAFEPNPEQYELLVHNAQLNNIQNIMSRPLGLWENDSTTLTLVGVDACARSEVVYDTSTEQHVFTTTTINTYGHKNNIDTLGLIMLDIEGSEFSVLKGATDYLERPTGEAPNVVFEVHRLYVDWSNGLQNAPIVKFLSDYGYHVFAVRDFQSNVNMKNCKIELIPPEETYLEGPPHGFNMLAIKDLSVIESDLFRICSGVSPKLLHHKDPHLHHPFEWR